MCICVPVSRPAFNGVFLPGTIFQWHMHRSSHSATVTGEEFRWWGFFCLYLESPVASRRVVMMENKGPNPLLWCTSHSKQHLHGTWWSRHYRILWTCLSSFVKIRDFRHGFSLHGTTRVEWWKTRVLTHFSDVQVTQNSICMVPDDHNTTEFCEHAYLDLRKFEVLDMGSSYMGQNNGCGFPPDKTNQFKEEYFCFCTSGGKMVYNDII